MVDYSAYHQPGSALVQHRDLLTTGMDRALYALGWVLISLLVILFLWVIFLSGIPTLPP